MITGDHVATAATIAAEVGITGRAATGQQLDSMSVDALAAVVDDIVYSPGSPGAQGPHRRRTHRGRSPR